MKEKDIVSTKDQEKSERDLRSYYSFQVDSIVPVRVKNVVDQEMKSLAQLLDASLGKDSAHRIIYQYMKFDPPMLDFSLEGRGIVLLLSTPTRPEFEYHFEAVGGNAYNINIKTHYMCEVDGNYVVPDANGPNGMYRIPRGMSLPAGMEYVLGSTLFTGHPASRFYFIYEGTYEDAAHDKYNVLTILAYDMVSHDVSTITSPKQEELLSRFRSLGSKI